MFSPSLDRCEIRENEGTYQSFVEAFRTFVADIFLQTRRYHCQKRRFGY